MSQPRREFTKEEVLEAHSKAGSLGDFIANLGFKRSGGNHQTGRKILKEHGLEAPKYDRSDHLAEVRKNLSNEEWFVDGVKRNNTNSKNRMIKLGIANQCACGQGPEWNDKPLVLELDHIDGNMFNNTLENLRIICGHCHSQTKNFCGSKPNNEPTYNYCECGRRISKESVRCRICSSKLRGLKIQVYDWPEIDEVCRMVKEKGFVYAGSQIGCSDNAVRKHLKNNGVDLKTL